MTQKPTTLRTRIYIDGYNLYYGCLKGTAHKWLDLRALFNLILPSVLYEKVGNRTEFVFPPLAIKYFTAPILRKFARSGDSVTCQNHYHAALSGHLGDSLKIVKGKYACNPARAYEYVKGENPLDSEMLEVWKLEEKRSDVSLALHAYGDALRNEVDQVVIVTNDTDLVPALEMIRSQTSAIIGLVVPSKEKVRKVNTSLDELSHWTRANIKDHELKSAQLPTPIPSAKTFIHKPLSWYPCPDKLALVFEEAKKVKGSKGAAWKWMNSPCDHLNGQIPTHMTENEDSFEKLWAYMNQYAKDFGH